MKKLSNTEAEFKKKSVAYKKACILYLNMVKINEHG